MIEKINSVKNPLSIIAIFAALAEVSGTGILPFIESGNQTIYIWYLMFFPFFLVSAFFVTLNLNPRVLYAPSDFRDEENYMQLFRPSTTSQKIMKIKEELEEIQEIEDNKTPEKKRALQHKEIISSKTALDNLLKHNRRAFYFLAVDLVISSLEHEFGVSAKREMSFVNKSGNHIFDAVFENRNALTLVEIKILSKSIHLIGIRKALERIASTICSLPTKVSKNTKIILAIAYYDIEKIKVQKVEHEIKSIILDQTFEVDLRMYAIDEIANEFKNHCEPGV